MSEATVFVISENPAVRDAVSELVASGGLLAEAFPSLEAWREAVPAARQGCVVLDGPVPDLSSPERLARLTATCLRHPVLLLVDRGDVPTAVSAIRAGVVEVIEKPLRNGHLLERIRTAAAASQSVDTAGCCGD